MSERRAAVDWKDRKLIPTNLPGYFTFVPPPPAFDPLEASHELLRQHGFPLPPDPRVAPQAMKTWRGILSRARHAVIPRLRVIPNRRGPLFWLREEPRQAINWSGAVLFNLTVPVHDVFGQWTLPRLTADLGMTRAPIVGASFSMSAWVGMDGTDAANQSLLQAGTAQDLTAWNVFGRTVVLGGGAYAWFEWYPDHPVAIDNFPIAPGETIAVMVQYHPDLNMGSASYLNLSSRAFTQVMFSPAAGAVFRGATAEWIVERPGIAGPIPDQFTNLPDFGVLTFTNLGAHSQLKNVLVDATDADPVSMLSNDGRLLLATGEVVSSGAGVRCSFVN